MTLRIGINKQYDYVRTEIRREQDSVFYVL